MRTVAHLTAAMLANRKLGWIEGLQIDEEEFETARAPPDIATKCVHVIRNPRLPMPSRERRREINSRKTDSARSEGVTSTSDNRSTAAKLREKIWSGIPLAHRDRCLAGHALAILILQYSRPQKRRP
ncbi:hypothetical protein [Bradyrhizobium sp. CCBAU 11357]|uniref:hypothetical protein n=1 Tax=Bradyrhizobium sp. CCBAU 11357 TaxID=1630808 RepID=UPI00230277FF|nr:hypothetical protein [Bradyrhizobium sp. CCBAU 11357]